MKEQEKQIKEMAKDINKTWFVKSNGDICGTNVKLKKNDIKMIAHQLVLEGYRKLPEDSVVLSREEYEKLKYTWITDSDAYKKGCKEMAEKIFKMLISKLESNQFLSGKRIIMEVDVENLAKQFDVEIEEL